MTTTTLPDGELQKLLVRMYMELWQKCNDPYLNLDNREFYCGDVVSDKHPLKYRYSYVLSISSLFLYITLLICRSSKDTNRPLEWVLLILSDENMKFFKDRLPRYEELVRQHEWLQDDHPHFASPKVVDLKTVQSFSDFCLWAEDNAIEDNDAMEDAIRKEGFLL